MPLNVQASHSEPEQNRSQGRKDDAPLRKKIYEWVLSIGTLGLLVVNVFLLSSTKKAANAAQRSADITKKGLDYTYEFVYSQQYASKVWVRMPQESFRIEPGKPISESIEIINYGAVPALVRARIYIEAGPRVIERLADDTAANKPPLGKEAVALPDVRDTRQVILGPNEGTDKFFPEPSKILTEENYRSVISGLAAGTTEVVVYGRIDYSDASGPWKERHNSIFCFYALKDKSPSACPNYEGKYTVWAR